MIEPKRLSVTASIGRVVTVGAHSSIAATILFCSDAPCASGNTGQLIRLQGWSESRHESRVDLLRALGRCSGRAETVFLRTESSDATALRRVAIVLMDRMARGGGFIEVEPWARPQAESRIPIVRFIRFARSGDYYKDPMREEVSRISMALESSVHLRGDYPYYFESSARIIRLAVQLQRGGDSTYARSLPPRFARSSERRVSFAPDGSVAIEAGSTGPSQATS